MSRTAVDIALSLLCILIQTTIVRFLAIGTVVPDVTLLWIVILAIRRGPIAGSSAGFGIGLALDMLAGPDGMLGLSALAKTLAGFIAGYFHNENKTAQTLGGFRFLTVVGIVGLVHAVVYFVIFLQGSGLPWWQAMFLHGIPYTLYTTAAALVPMFTFARKVPV